MAAFSRKQFLKLWALGGLLSVTPGKELLAEERLVVAAAKKRLLRVAHITDVHVQPKSPAPNGFASALHTIQSLEDKPDFIINTGDSVMDSLGRFKDNVQGQWDVWNSTLKNENSLEIKHCIGNHDIWGWSNPLVAKKSDNHYGKLWATEQFGIPHRYYSFEKGGWQFIVLDSMTYNKFSYTAEIDEEQFDWLKQELQKIPADRHICILSHIPILAVNVFFDGPKMRRGHWDISGRNIHKDAKRLKDLFHQHKNVKAALSGHIHLIDEVDYLGVKYYCNGAVCGAWWEGDNQEFPPAFAVMNFYDDGSTEREIVYYDWKK